jgi:2-polyprenyl-6-methoxyphenol hydroxylase-like FAD-dependent oxidoreductase
MGKAFDVIVVGARCAGSTTAMLLARKGYRVLTVDRASFPGDTVSTHILHPSVQVRSRWGLLERLGDRMPAYPHLRLRLGAFTIAGARARQNLLPTVPAGRSSTSASTPGRIRHGHPSGFRRQGLSKASVWSASGRSKHGGSVTEYADVIVGADGRHSMVSEAVPRTIPREAAPAGRLLRYWSGCPWAPV